MSRIFLFFKNFFKISYQEARGFFALMTLAFFAMIFILFPDLLIPKENHISPQELLMLDSLEALLSSKSAPTRFYFNPNNLSQDSLLLLGFQPEVARRLINYRDKGGRFEKKSDLGKVYGISSSLLDSLHIWIDLPENISNPAVSKALHVDINEATVDQLKALRTIGDMMAARIVNYRDLLGGFTSTAQFQEVYGISAETIVQLTSFTYIRFGFKPKQIKINFSDFIALSRHPYISDELARDIVQYREVNSTIESEKVLAVFKSVDKANFERLILYLDFQH